MPSITPKQAKQLRAAARKAKALLNPYNWNVEDFSSESSFSSAYKKARLANLKEFIFNGKRYNTDYKGTSNEQYNKYGNTNTSIRSGVDLDDYTKDVLDAHARTLDYNTMFQKGMGESMDDIYTLHKFIGNPKISLDQHNQNIRSRYSPLTNTMTLNSYNDYADEAAHSTQSNILLRGVYDWIKNPYITQKGYDKNYKRPGTVEYEAHKIIEPFIRKMLAGEVPINRTKKPNFTWQQGATSTW